VAIEALKIHLTSFISSFVIIFVERVQKIITIVSEFFDTIFDEYVDRTLVMVVKITKDKITIIKKTLAQITVPTPTFRQFQIIL